MAGLPSSYLLPRLHRLARSEKNEDENFLTECLAYVLSTFLEIEPESAEPLLARLERTGTWYRNEPTNRGAQALPCAADGGWLCHINGYPRDVDRSQGNWSTLRGMLKPSLLSLRAWGELGGIWTPAVAIHT